MKKNESFSVIIFQKYRRYSEDFTVSLQDADTVIFKNYIFTWKVRRFKPFQRKKDRGRDPEMRRRRCKNCSKKKNVLFHRAHSHCIFNGIAHVHVCIWRWQTQKKNTPTLMYDLKKVDDELFFAPSVRHCNCKPRLNKDTCELIIYSTKKINNITHFR